MLTCRPRVKVIACLCKYFIVLYAVYTTVAYAESENDEADAVPSIDAIGDLFGSKVVDHGEAEVTELDYIDLENLQTIYVTKNRKYLVVGTIYAIGEDSPRNLTSTHKWQRIVSQIDVKDTVAFTPPDGTKSVVHVFTDHTCGYCRRLHSDLYDYLDYGIEIRYLAFPREGLQSEAFDQLSNAWCAKDRQKALTALKSGKTISERKCKNPVAQHYKFGIAVGVSGTPALVLESGEVLPGFRTSSRSGSETGLGLVRRAKSAWELA